MPANELDRVGVRRVVLDVVGRDDLERDAQLLEDRRRCGEVDARTSFTARGRLTEASWHEIPEPTRNERLDALST